MQEYCIKTRYIESIISFFHIATCKVQGLPEVDTAEAMGMRNASEFARDMGFLNIQAETDSMQVVLAMKSRKQTHSYFGRLITDCLNMSHAFANFMLLDGNKLAHKLAKYALA